MGILLELDKIRKEYPGTVANDDISLEVQYGEVYALLGENGAGKRIKELSNKYSLEIDPFKKVSEFTVGQQQRVEIIKALYSDCKLLILDEPTAVLTPQEIEELFVIINQFKSENKSVIFITHKLNEVMRVSDRIRVIYEGKILGEMNREDATVEEIGMLMAGHKQEA